MWRVDSKEDYASGGTFVPFPLIDETLCLINLPTSGGWEVILMNLWASCVATPILLSLPVQFHKNMLEGQGKAKGMEYYLLAVGMDVFNPISSCSRPYLPG